MKNKELIIGFISMLVVLFILSFFNTMTVIGFTQGETSKMGINKMLLYDDVPPSHAMNADSGSGMSQNNDIIDKHDSSKKLGKMLAQLEKAPPIRKYALLHPDQKDLNILLDNDNKNNDINPSKKATNTSNNEDEDEDEDEEEDKILVESDEEDNTLITKVVVVDTEREKVSDNSPSSKPHHTSNGKKKGKYVTLKDMSLAGTLILVILPVSLVLFSIFVTLVTMLHSKKFINAIPWSRKHFSPPKDAESGPDVYVRKSGRRGRRKKSRGDGDSGLVHRKHHTRRKNRGKKDVIVSAIESHALLIDDGHSRRPRNHKNGGSLSSPSSSGNNTTGGEVRPSHRYKRTRIKHAHMLPTLSDINKSTCRPSSPNNKYHSPTSSYMVNTHHFDTVDDHIVIECDTTDDEGELCDSPPDARVGFSSSSSSVVHLTEENRRIIENKGAQLKAQYLTLEEYIKKNANRYIAALLYISNNDNNTDDEHGIKKHSSTKRKKRLVSIFKQKSKELAEYAKAYDRVCTLLIIEDGTVVTPTVYWKQRAVTCLRERCDTH